MSLRIKVRRTTLAQLESAVGSKALLQGEPYWITDQQQFAIGIDDESYKIIGGVEPKNWVLLGTLNNGENANTVALNLEQSAAYTVRITVQCSANNVSNRMTAQVIADMAVFYVNVGAHSAHETDGVSIVSNVGPIIPVPQAAITSIKMGDILIEPYKPSNMLQFKITNNTGFDGVAIRYHIETVKHDM